MLEVNSFFGQTKIVKWEFKWDSDKLWVIYINIEEKKRKKTAKPKPLSQLYPCA